MKTLDRAKWHRPLVSVIVTHHNYSDYVEDALLSILDQSHENWECVVVDDASTPAHLQRVREIIAEIGSPKIKLLELTENVGQILTFFRGVDATSGAFACLLDPDDRYTKTFLEETLAAHLNPSVICPMVCTDQYLLGEAGLIAGCNAQHWQRRLPKARVDALRGMTFYPPSARGWHWTSTSSMMFRRSALECLRPIKRPAYKGSADSYLASGAHRLGGGLFLHASLIYRQVHGRNAWMTNGIISSFQTTKKPEAFDPGETVKNDAIEALVGNGASLPSISRPGQRSGPLARWRRSFDKRWASVQRWRSKRCPSFGKIESLSDGQIKITGRKPSLETLAQLKDRVGPNETAVEISADVAHAYIRANRGGPHAG
jgi:glycosyltransferase involved in cell wall biosynthesis